MQADYFSTEAAFNCLVNIQISFLCLSPPWAFSKAVISLCMRDQVNYGNTRNSKILDSSIARSPEKGKSAASFDLLQNLNNLAAYFAALASTISPTNFRFWSTLLTVDTEKFRPCPCRISFGDVCSDSALYPFLISQHAGGSARTLVLIGTQDKTG